MQTRYQTRRSPGAAAAECPIGRLILPIWLCHSASAHLISTQLAPKLQSLRIHSYPVTMSKLCFTLLLSFLFFFLTMANAAQDAPPDIDADTWARVQDMSVAVKIGQMSQLNIDGLMSGNFSTRREAVTLNTTQLEEIIGKYHVGSVLNSPFASHSFSQGPAGVTPEEWLDITRTIHEVSARIDGIPSLYGIDSVHGANYIYGSTLFPQQINAAATFNPKLVEKQGEITAKDTRASGIEWLFAPILDIAVHPLWPRVFETFGEDPLLASAMGHAIIRGIQGVKEDGKTPDLDSDKHAAATFKHFIGYSNPRDGHDRSEVWIPDQQLLEYFVPSFQEAIQKAHVATGMLTYTEVNGVPATINRHLTIDLLRNRLQFNGTLVTDMNELYNLIQWHHSTPDIESASFQTLASSSTDMVMLKDHTDGWFNSVSKLIESGVISEKRLDIGVAHVLQLKKNLGLVEKYIPNGFIPGPNYPGRTSTTDDEDNGAAKDSDASKHHRHSHSNSRLTDKERDRIRTIGQQADLDVALDAARESIILLENDGTLPVLLEKVSGQPSSTSEGHHRKKGTDVKKILVVGPTGNSLVRQTGGWTFHWQGALSDDEFGGVGMTIFQAVQTLVSKANPDIEVTYASGVNIDGSFTEEQLDEALKAAADADLVIACVGEETYAEKPGDISDLRLPWGQQMLVNRLTALPKHSTHAHSHSSSHTHQHDKHDSNNDPNKHVVLVLVEGRPRTFDILDLSRVRAVLLAFLPGPQGGEAIAEIIFGDINPSGRLPITYPSATGDLPLQYYHLWSQARNYQPQWEVGHGLSYAQFGYGPIKLSSNEITPQQTLNVSITVTNVGAVEGQEVVLCFVSDVYRAPIAPEVKRLRAFEKIKLQPGEKKQVTFTLDYSSFSFIGPDLRRQVESGEFIVSIASSNASFHLTVPSSDQVGRPESMGDEKEEAGGESIARKWIQRLEDEIANGREAMRKEREEQDRAQHIIPATQPPQTQAGEAFTNTGDESSTVDNAAASPTTPNSLHVVAAPPTPLTADKPAPRPARTPSTVVIMLLCILSAVIGAATMWTFMRPSGNIQSYAAADPSSPSTRSFLHSHAHTPMQHHRRYRKEQVEFHQRQGRETSSNVHDDGDDLYQSF